MTRLIDADSMSKRDGESIRLIDANAINYDDYWWHKGYSARDCQQAAKLISEQPTVQAIPIEYMQSQVDCGKWQEIIQRWREHEQID